MHVSVDRWMKSQPTCSSMLGDVSFYSCTWTKEWAILDIVAYNLFANLPLPSMQEPSTWAVFKRAMKTESH